MSRSIIVVSWNGRQYLEPCLDAALAQMDSGDELIVVDNGSTDGSPALVRARYPDVRLIESEANQGFAGGANLGLEAARGEALFLLNQDVVLQGGALAAMSGALADPTVGVVGCKVLYPDGTVQHAGGVIRWPRAVADHHGVDQPDDGRWDVVQDVDYVTGAVWAFRRDVLETVGGLDLGFWPAYYEDTDYCFRARAAGLRVVYVPGAVAIHAESTALGKGSPAYLQAFHRGRLRFVLKHLPPERVVSEFAAAERAWLTGPAPAAEQSVMTRVYRSALAMAPRIYAQRQQVPPQRFRRVVDLLAGLARESALGFELKLEGGRLSEASSTDLERHSVVREQPFRSDRPLIGGLIAWFRTVWNNVSSRWYVLPLLQQQNAFNARVAAHLEELSGRAVGLDRDLTALTRDVAELTHRLIQVERRLGALEARQGDEADPPPEG